MSSALVVALISGVVALGSAAIAAWAQFRVKALERAAQEEENRSQARVVLDRYRGPLLDAAWDLGDRIDNVTDRDFFDTFGTGERQAMAIQTTLFRVAQYFGWVEIVRREVQLLRFESAADTRRAAYFISLVMRRFATDWYDCDAAREQARAWIAGFETARVPERHLMLWHEEQRGVGERMIDGNGALRCKGFATFIDDYETAFSCPFSDFAAGLRNPGVAKSLRLVEVRDALARLVVQLDDEKRYQSGESDYETWVDRARRSPCWNAYSAIIAGELQS